MPKTCDGLTIAGPFPQTLFLGCSIVSFTANAGWDSQATEITVQLVKDTCASPTGSHKAYWDTTLTQREWTAADPGFIGLDMDIVGCPVYFRVADFEFNGIIQSWEEDKDFSSNPSYKVIIVDPRQLLQNSTAIIGKYAGGVSTIFNVFNVYGFLESFSTLRAPELSLVNGTYTESDSLPDGPTFGSPAGGYGFAGVNNNGILWTKLISGLNLLINAVPHNVSSYSPYGRIIYKGIALTGDVWTNGFGLLQCDRNDIGTVSEYFLDISELPTPPTYYRIGADNINLLDIITSLCDDSGYSFYVELVTIRNAYNLSPSGIAKLIKIRTVRRSTQPDLNHITSFVDNNTDGSLSVRHGAELRNETTSAICYGGQKETLYQITNPYQSADTILPYFGLDPWTGNVIIPTWDSINNEWYIWVDTTFLNANLIETSEIGTVQGPLNHKFAYITETEMMAAIAGYDMWLSTATILARSDFDIDGHPRSSTGKAIDNDENNKKRGVWFIYDIIEKIAAQLGEENKNIDHRAILGNVKDRLQVDKQNAKEWEEVQMIYGWVKSFAENLGRRFMVRVPYTCAILEGDSAQIITSENPTNGGWTEQTSILGIDTTSTLSNFMRLSDNKFSAMLTFYDTPATGVNDIPKDISAIGENYFIYNDYIYIQADVENEYQYENKLAALNPVAILNIPGPVTTITDDLPQDCRGIFKLIDLACGATGTGRAYVLKQQLWNANNSGVGPKSIYAPLPYNFDTKPSGATCGIHSNVLTYGPWFSIGSAGGTFIKHEEGLVPWEFNGYTAMNVAGAALASAGLTDMRVGEMGDITVAGYPVIPLGAELGAYAGGIYSAGTQLVENRIASLSQSDIGEDNVHAYWDSPAKWQGIYGPNVTSINVGFSTEGVKTQYSMRTYTPKFGRFSKVNVDRLKTVGKLQIKAQQSYTRWLAPRIQAQYNSELRNRSRPYRISARDVGLQLANHSPHDLLAGSIFRITSDYSSTRVVSEPLMDLHGELSGYSTKAIVSLDALFRPVSLDGDGGLPKLATPTNSGVQYTQASHPPVSQYNYPASYELYNTPIFSKYLQPLQNPTGFNNALAINRAISGGGEGHDIAMVARGSTYPSGNTNQGMYMPDASGDTASSYTNDYRTMALKGPLLLHGWGYDTEGRPVPNSGDLLASSGIFNSVGKGDKFIANWLRKPETWPVAPVDLRYDRQRGVWTTPPAQSLIIGQLEGTLSPTGYTTAKLLYGPNIYNNNGSLLSYNNITVNVYDKLMQVHQTGDIVYLYYNNIATGLLPSPHTGEYHILAGGTSTRCSGSLTENLTENRNSTFIDNIGPIDGLQSPVASCANGVGLICYIQLNPHGSGGYNADDNTVCYIEKHLNDNTWWIYAMPCQD